MEKLIKSVNEVIAEEYYRASEKFGTKNNSDHESFSIMAEELQEGEEEFKVAAMNLGKFWKLVRDKEATDADKEEVLKKIQNEAMLTACEFIQVAAMAYKARITIQERRE